MNISPSKRTFEKYKPQGLFSEFYGILRSEKGCTSFNYDNSAKFSGEKKYNDAFQGVYSLTIRKKTLHQILSSNLKVSVLSTRDELISNE